MSLFYHMCCVNIILISCVGIMHRVVTVLYCNIYVNQTRKLDRIFVVSHRVGMPRETMSAMHRIVFIQGGPGLLIQQIRLVGWFGRQAALKKNRLLAEFDFETTQHGVWTEGAHPMTGTGTVSEFGTRLDTVPVTAV